MTEWQVAWDLFQIPLGVAAAYGVAVWKGRCRSVES